MHASSLWEDLKKRGLQKCLLHYNTKIIITESNNQVLGELLLRKTEGN